ncbi:DUF4440 domain-containing protein [Burkholderia sp. IDO3]|uniref:DUF4440 domain-containing protein n=1 Tax=Burkholderia sp. IDO3 TaxID=1705310 RepID=UPI000BBA6A6C|nr:DUF4440 domain-containing protein [Burkholderia sp. IDO3]AXK66687.1 DUF4440 domain-containing protein [Burkholderia sp. IDO3]PCD58782.1 hypothetical protein CN645_27450 [Burkholderia sp. IDO3]
MKNKYSLLQMRDVWIDAYMNNDIDQLNFMENPHFFVKQGDRILTKPQQISHLQRHLSEKGQRNFDLQVHNEITAITESPHWASISGTGSTRRDGSVLTRFKFLELWLIHDDRWQIAALCYDEQECEGGMTENRPDTDGRWER